MQIVELGKPIALGRTAEIYPWNEDKVIKLFRAGWSNEWAEHEAMVARSVQAAGLPVPALVEVIEVNGRSGLVYERVEGPSLMDVMAARPWKMASAAVLMADLQATMHTRVATELPSISARLERHIRTSGKLANRLKVNTLVMLRELPDGNMLCHGDFHPANILITARGPVVIDWPDAARGDPLADVARTAILLGYSPLPSDAPRHLIWIVRIVRKVVYRVYLRRYFRRAAGSPKQLEPWLPVVAAARLAEEVPGEDDILLGLVQKGVDRYQVQDRRQAG